MFDFNDTPHDEALNQRIAKLLEELSSLTGDSEGYSKTADNLAKLMKLKYEANKLGNEFDLDAQKINLDKDKLASESAKLSIDMEKVAAERDKVRLEEEKLEFEKTKFEAEQEKARSWKPSPDAVVSAAAGIVGILAILQYEKFGAVTSKALSFVGRLRN